MASLAHPVAQLKHRVNPMTQPLQQPFRPRHTRSRIFHTIYDGSGKRVKKVTDLETTVFVYDGLGKLVAEYSTATPPANPTINYTATDKLGSPRVITDKFGNVVSRRDFLPFGEEIYANSTANRTEVNKYSLSGQDSVRKRFTGYEKDLETGLDFAEARYYQNQHGRFTAVDPLLTSGKNGNPQTFNRYVYVLNNPSIFTDPSGLQLGDHDGAVYYKVFSNGAWAFSDRTGKGYNTRYEGPAKTIVGVDGYKYRVRANGWTQGAKVANGKPVVIASASQGISTTVTKPEPVNKVPELVKAVNNAPMFPVAEAIHKVATPDGVTVSAQVPYKPALGASLTVTSDLDVVWAPAIQGSPTPPPMSGAASASFTWATDTDATSTREQRTSFFTGDSINVTACGRVCVGGVVVPGNGEPRTGATVGVSTSRGVSSSFSNGRYVTNLLGLRPPDDQER